MNSAINVPAVSANGGTGEFVYNINDVLGAVASFNGVHNGNISDVHIDTTLVGYNFGPRVTWRNGSRWMPFGEILFGATTAHRSFKVPGLEVNPVSGNTFDLETRFANTARAFSMLVGGGLDVKVNKNVSFRPIKLDYYMTRFQPIFIEGLGDPNRNRNQNNLIYGTGFNFRF